MSLDVHHDGATSSKTHELVSTARAQSASLLALQAVTALLARNADLPSLLSCSFDPDNTKALTFEQCSWLKGNSLAYGRQFDESSLPIPQIDDIPPLQTTAEPAASKQAAPETSQPADGPRLTRAASHLQSTPRLTKDVTLEEIVPAEPEEQANFDAPTQQLVDNETPKAPAKTVHLPPEHVQEEKYRHRQSSSDVDVKKSVRARSDAPSSPSSTVDAHSATTPMQAQDSPNTSPDSETAVEVPLEFRPSPTEQRAKEQHDRQLAAQKAIAHDAALGDVNTPDDQLKWEEREAAAREAEETKATEDRNGPEPNVKLQERETDAESFANEKEDEARAESSHADLDATMDATDRGRLTRMNTSISEQTNSRPDTATTPKSAIMISIPDRRLSTTSSPSLARRAALEAPAVSVPLPQTEQDIMDLIPDLANLRGAAEDPDRDYLESLFRIQAHDSPHIKTTPIPELLKHASKTVSTDDHYASVHERMEYRILRRIYHLQNANKWSLRQMDKAREPDAPFTQHDHMMAEMKWLCKDFRSERKRKKHICAWLAQRCADWVAASAVARKQMQVQVKDVRAIETPEHNEYDDVPELEPSGDSPPQIEVIPGTPQDSEPIFSRIIVDPELLDSVMSLHHNGVLPKALKQLPVWKPDVELDIQRHSAQPMLEVSKFVSGKVLPKIERPNKKRSRYDYDDEGEDDEESHVSKRSRIEADLPPEDPNCAIFHADNKPIRDRLHTQNAFRPPSEFTMPIVSFYEFRYGSCWLPEDDHKLRRLAKDFAFNWSAISDQLTLPSKYKSGYDRRTPWECFERWVELEQMPVEMRKTAYFKTWYQRLEQSQQAVEKRYQAQLAILQAQSAQSGITPQQQPSRRRTLPMRVEKRKNQRYLWIIDAMRKNAKKREMNQYKQAEATRAAAQRKASQQAEPRQAPQQKRLTPQEFSQKRHERDIALAKMQAVQREQLLEKQRQAQLARAAAAQGLTSGVPGAQRQGMTPVSGQNVANQMAAAQLNAANLTPQQRQQLAQMANRNGQFPIANGQNVPAAQMQATTAQQQQNMQRMLQQQQVRNGINGQQQIAAMQNGNVLSPGPGGLNQQQQYANSQALMAAYKAQQIQQANMAQGAQSSPAQQHAMTASPSMGPPPMPAQTPQQLSSGHVPAVIKIQNQLRASYPHMTEEQLRAYATDRLKTQSAQRTHAMSAAAGMNNANMNGGSNTRAFQQNQAIVQNGNMSNGSNGYSPQDNSSQQTAMSGMSGNAQHSYAQMMRQRQMNQMAQMQQTQNTTSNGSPVVSHASPNMNPASPSLQFSNMAGQRPPSRSATPQMQRLGSSGGVPGVAVSGMQSPGAAGLQASPRSVQANIAR